jgi:alanine dehydrogenase
LITGTSETKAADLARWVTSITGIAAEAADAEATSAADIIAACTTSATPVVIDAQVKPGAHVNAVGAFTPATRELPSGLVSRARVYVDTRAGAFSEAGDLLLAVNDGAFSLENAVGEIGEGLLSKVPARENDDEVTVYKSVGAAFLDAATARLAYQAATRLTVGSAFDFDVG